MTRTRTSARFRRHNALAALQGDLEAVTRYKELAARNPTLRKEYLQRARQAQQSADRWIARLTACPRA